jgi:hypothetical protein
MGSLLLETTHSSLFGAEKSTSSRELCPDKQIGALPHGDCALARFHIGLNWQKPPHRKDSGALVGPTGFEPATPSTPRMANIKGFQPFQMSFFQILCHSSLDFMTPNHSSFDKNPFIQRAMDHHQRNVDDIKVS